MQNNSQKCPVCSSNMVLRLASKGSNKGNQFYGCSRFPRCRGTRPYIDESQLISKVEQPQNHPNEAKKYAGATSQNVEISKVSNSKVQRPLTDQQRKELVRLRDRLLNLSSRNRSIRLNRLDAKWTFDLSYLNPFGNETANELLQHCLKENTPKNILPKSKNSEEAELHLKLSKRLTHLYRSVTDLEREKGLHDLYIGFPFLVGFPIGSNTVIQAPVFLLPVTLEKITPKKGAANWILKSSKDVPAVFNKTLFFALSKLCKLTINQNIFDEEIPNELYGASSFIDKTHELLNEYGIHCVVHENAKDQELDKVPEFSVKELPSSFHTGKFEVCQYAVLGHFPQSNSSIQKDYEKFLESDQDDLEPITCFLSPEQTTNSAKELSTNKSVETNIPSDSVYPEYPSDPQSTHTIDHRKESENFFLLPSDSSQDRILLELGNTKNVGMVVWGPPGTGKSQTIVNIIGDCLAHKKTVLLVSQKRAALDVVYDRIGFKELDNLVGLVHDSKQDRKSLYSKINNQTTQSDPNDGKLTNVPIDPSIEMDRVTGILREVSRAYCDDAYGIKLGELYQKLGGRKDGLVSIETVYWKNKKSTDLTRYKLQLSSLQNRPIVQSSSPFFLHRKSLSKIDQHELPELIIKFNELIQGTNLLESIALIYFKNGNTKAASELLPKPTEHFQNYLETLKQYHAIKGVTRYLRPTFWKLKNQLTKFIQHAHKKIQHDLNEAKIVFGIFFKPDVANQLIRELPSTHFDRKSLVEFAKTIENHFYELKGYDIAFEELPAELKPIAEVLELAIIEGKLNKSEDWGSVFERSVYAVWVAEIERKHPIITQIRSGQIDSLRQQYQKLLNDKASYCAHLLKERTKHELTTVPGTQFKREINADVSKTRNTFSIRKLNEKYINHPIYRSTIPVWLVSPEAVSDVFPLIKGLFDVVIFDEASQCTVEHGLPAIYRGKQVIIAGDEKQLPPSRLFESTVEDDPDEDELAYATDEPSLLTLAKKTLRYRSHMLEWHYRSQHQELITFSNEVFYGGRMKIAPNVIPFKKGNAPAIAWHSVNGFWEDRTNREEAVKVIERIRYFLSSENPPTLGVITFNAPQKELIRDLIEETQANDPEFDEIIKNDKKRPIDAQLFVKNIENVQGDEREIIIFSVAYARSDPSGRVNQFFGSLNAKGGENRLNVAVTRAIKRVEIVASIEPQRDLDVSTSLNVGPRVLRNYLRFAHSVAAENFDNVNLILKEINPNLQLRSNGGTNVIESPLEAEVLSELQKIGYDIHTQVGQSGFRIDMAIVHPKDPKRYLLGIECDGAMYHSAISVRERDVFRQHFLEDRGWVIHRIWSTNWWDNKDKELQRLRLKIDSLLDKSVSGGSL